MAVVHVACRPAPGGGVGAPARLLPRADDRRPAGGRAWRGQAYEGRRMALPAAPSGPARGAGRLPGALAGGVRAAHLRRPGTGANTKTGRTRLALGFLTPPRSIGFCR